MWAKYFYDMISLLRKSGEVVLYNNILTISPAERENTTAFLKLEYQRECLNYPFTPPLFHPEAAIWGAEMIYISAQLLLYRQDSEAVLGDILPKENLEITSETLLSADLCLRFIPGIIFELKSIDKDDSLIPLLETVLDRWHYSGIQFSHPKGDISWERLLENECFQQLYTNRIIKYKNIELASIPLLNHSIQVAFGIQGERYWPEFKPVTP